MAYSKLQTVKIFPQWDNIFFHSDWSPGSHHTGSQSHTLEVRQIQLAKAILNDNCVAMFLSISFTGPKPLASLPLGQCASFLSAPLLHTMASILRCSWPMVWPMVWPMLPGPWNSLSCETLITQTSCADFKRTHTNPRTSSHGARKQHKYTSPVLKPASNLLINPPCCPGWKKHFWDHFFCSCRMKHSPNPKNVA